MRPIITVTAVVLLHLCVIAVLVGVNGCRSTSGFEQEGDPAAFSGGARPASSSAALVAVPTTAKMVVPAPTKVTPIVASGPGGVHVVVKGESLPLIASREKTSIAALCAANGLDRNAILHPGQKLKIPAAGSAPAPKTTKASSGKTTPKVTPAATSSAPAAPQFSPLKIISLSNPAAAEPNAADASAAPAATK